MTFPFRYDFDRAYTYVSAKLAMAANGEKNANLQNKLGQKIIGLHFRAKGVFCNEDSEGLLKTKSK